jgi:hypothetical protein
MDRPLIVLEKGNGLFGLHMTPPWWGPEVIGVASHYEEFNGK